MPQACRHINPAHLQCFCPFQLTLAAETLLRFLHVLQISYFCKRHSSHIEHRRSALLNTAVKGYWLTRFCSIIALIVHLRPEYGARLQVVWAPFGSTQPGLHNQTPCLSLRWFWCWLTSFRGQVLPILMDNSTPFDVGWKFHQLRTLQTPPSTNHIS